MLILLGFKAAGLSHENRRLSTASPRTTPQCCFLNTDIKHRKIQKDVKSDDVLILLGFKAAGLSYENRLLSTASPRTKPQWYFRDTHHERSKNDIFLLIWVLHRFPSLLGCWTLLPDVPMLPQVR